MLCLLVLQNTSLKNSGKFRIMLLDSSSVAPNLIMSPLSFIACTGSLSIRDSTTRFLLSVSKFWNQLRPLTSLISYMFTLPPPPPHPPRQFCSSSDDRFFCVPYVRTKSYGQRSFAYQGANTWNQLPLSVRHSQSLASFKTKLKTHLFPK